MIDTASLNSNQLEAANWDNGPLLVLAGPGSGKTRVLTYRIARLIADSPDKNFRVLGLTFTNKASSEMKDRIEDLVPNVGDRVLLTTFHSFAAKVLSQHGSHIGLEPDFTILTQDADRQLLLDDAIKQAGIVQEMLTGERLLPLVTWLVENDVSPEQSLQTLEKGSFSDPRALATIYQNYRKIMIDQNCLDFAGLIAETLNLLRSQDGVRKLTQTVYPYICVDEFQDTNRSQYKMLQLLVSPKSKNLFVVADDDQIIYQWNGASTDRLRELKDDFQAEVRQLPENYRCPAEVVELANHLIEKNSDRIAEKGALKPYKETNNSRVVNVGHFSNFSEEAEWVVQNIAERDAEQHAGCVVLARTRKMLEQIIESMEECGMCGYLASRKTEFESAPLRWLHSILRLTNSRNRREHLSRVCKAFYDLEGINLDVNDVMSHASAEDGDYLRSWVAVLSNRSELSGGAKKLLNDSVLHDLADRLDFKKFQEAAFHWFDALPDSVPDIEGIFNEYAAERGIWEQLVGNIIAQHGTNEITLHRLLQELDLRSKSPEPPQGAIPCYTIHASKGMEFKHVYLVGMVESQLPSWSAVKKGDESREMQEERRNCFVAITRTIETLTLTYSDRVNGYKKEPSRFLYEMGVLEAS